MCSVLALICILSFLTLLSIEDTGSFVLDTFCFRRSIHFLEEGRVICFRMSTQQILKVCFVTPHLQRFCVLDFIFFADMLFQKHQVHSLIHSSSLNVQNREGFNKKILIQVNKVIFIIYLDLLPKIRTYIHINNLFWVARTSSLLENNQVFKLPPSLL